LQQITFPETTLYRIHVNLPAVDQLININLAAGMRLRPHSIILEEGYGVIYLSQLP